jgi:hypothetical protein
MEEIHNGLYTDGLFYLPVFTVFRKKKNKRFWTKLYNRDIDSTEMSATRDSYEYILGRIEGEQETFLTQLSNTGDRLIAHYMESNVFWAVEPIKIFRSAIIYKNRSIVLYLLSKYQWTKSHKRLFKTLITVLNDSRITEDAVQIALDVLPILEIPANQELVDTLFINCFNDKALSLFTWLLDHNYVFKQEYIYKIQDRWALSHKLSDFIAKIIEKCPNINLSPLLSLAIFRNNLETAQFVIQAGCEVDIYHINGVKYLDKDNELRKYILSHTSNDNMAVESKRFKT